MEKQKSPIDVLLPVMISADLLFEHPDNAQKQSKHEQNELRKSIRENGFDESLLVIPREDDIGYWIIAGNHRKRAGLAEGMEEFPCVIRDDWDNIRAQIELVRRNYVRGKIDKNAFTLAVNKLHQEEGISIEDIYTEMGFESPDTFASYYKEEKEQEEKLAREVASSDAGIVKMIDDLGFIVSSIINQYGSTAPHSFIIFPTSGKNHLFIASNPGLKKTLEQIATACVAQHLDINVALAGILSIGLNQTNFLSNSGKKEILEEVDKYVGEEEDLDTL